MTKITKLGAALTLSLGCVVATNAPVWAQDPPILPPIYSDTCSPAQIEVLQKAHANMALMLEDALVGVEGDFETDAYITSFGVSDPARDAKVFTHLLLLRFGAALIQMTANCVPPGSDATCDDGAWAYVGRQQVGVVDNPYIINFCSGYFEATDASVKEFSIWDSAALMQGGVFFHELTHFSWSTKSLFEQVGMDPGDDIPDQAGSDDHEYSAEFVEQLAKTKPEKAILNADSYHIFVMKRAARRGIVKN